MSVGEVGLLVVTLVAALAGGGWLGWIAARRGGPTEAGQPPVVAAQAPAIEPAPAVSTALLVDVVDNHRVGVVVVDEAGRTIVRNPAVERHAGTHVGALLDAVILRHLNAARDGVAGGETIEIYGPPQTVLVVEAYPLGAAGQGGRSGAVAFVADVSDQRRTEQVRTDFVANISHELKTPIGAISVLAEALDGETDPDVIARLIARLDSEADRAARTIDDLMELSELELANERVTDDIAVDAVVRAALDRVAELATQRSIGVSMLDIVDAGGDRQPLVVRGDRRQLTSAVGNLVENAVKYSDQGGQVTVRLVVASEPTEPASVGIVVTDRGIGIPARDVQRIFERFYRVDRARARATGGTGLGLSIVRHVANRHGGRVEVNSEEGRGSTFTLWLPLAEGQASATESPSSATVDEQEIA